MNTISPGEFHARMNSGQTMELVDVRTPSEFREIHIRGARLMPLDLLDPREIMAARSPDLPLYLVCGTGKRAGVAAEKFTQAGFVHAVVIEGGMTAWKKENLPAEHGAKTISLERQVRIAAGSLVLLGSVAGYFVHPALIGLSALVGAGLVFAGITDTCGMGLLLSKMPWNK